MPRLPNMVKPAGKATRHELTYYDGERRIVYTVDEGYNQNDGTIPTRVLKPAATSTKSTASSPKTAATASAKLSAQRTKTTAIPISPKPGS